MDTSLFLHHNKITHWQNVLVGWVYAPTREGNFSCNWKRHRELL